MPITTNVICFVVYCKDFEASLTNSLDPVQTALGPHCLPLYYNLSIILGNYLQQITEADDIFRCIFSALKKRLLLSPEFSLQGNFHIIEILC